MVLRHETDDDNDDCIHDFYPLHIGSTTCRTPTENKEAPHGLTDPAIRFQYLDHFLDRFRSEREIRH
jgi:hypothetical protein